MTTLNKFLIDTKDKSVFSYPKYIWNYLKSYFLKSKDKYRPEELKIKSTVYPTGHPRTDNIFPFLQREWEGKRLMKRFMDNPKPKN